MDMTPGSIESMCDTIGPSHLCNSSIVLSVADGFHQPSCLITLSRSVLRFDLGRQICSVAAAASPWSEPSHVSNYSRRGSDHEKGTLEATTLCLFISDSVYKLCEVCTDKHSWEQRKNDTDLYTVSAYFTRCDNWVWNSSQRRETTIIPMCQLFVMNV